ncbi:MAG: hypothetical protein MZV70_49405 [Desulfobacterales bacterium]|nr:hypothetical protein [Desulfobacterales bacterium]
MRHELQPLQLGRPFFALLDLIGCSGHASIPFRKKRRGAWRCTPSCWTSGRARIRRGKPGVAQTIGHLGYVQIDTISVIERAHHHTLWTRVPGYNGRSICIEALAVERPCSSIGGTRRRTCRMKDYRFYHADDEEFLRSQERLVPGLGARNTALISRRCSGASRRKGRWRRVILSISPRPGPGAVVGLEAGQGGAGDALLARRADDPRAAGASSASTT